MLFGLRMESRSPWSAHHVEDRIYNLSDLKPGHLRCRTPLLKSEASHSTLTGRESECTHGNRHIQYLLYCITVTVV